MATRWSRVKGPISSAIATLLDHGFEPRAFNQWVDPEGWLWCIDYDAPNLLSAVREILSHHLCKRIWAVACPEHVEPLGGMPDITAYKELAKEFARARLHSIITILMLWCRARWSRMPSPTSRKMRLLMLSSANTVTATLVADLFGLILLSSASLCLTSSVTLIL